MTGEIHRFTVGQNKNNVAMSPEPYAIVNSVVTETRQSV